MHAYRQYCKDVCIVVDRVPVVACLSVQGEAGNATSQQPDGQAHFVFSEAHGGEGGLGRVPGGGVPSGIAKVDHAVQEVLEACDESVQQHFSILNLHGKQLIVLTMSSEDRSHF